MKIAINGFGRIGKQFFLACMEKKVNFDIVINHSADLDFIVYTLKYDSVHPVPNVEIKHDGKNIIFGGKKFRVYNILEPEKLPWKSEKIDLVVECTGMFTAREDAMKHIKAGAKRVLISAPAKGNDVTIIPGVNDRMLKNEHKIISAGSCTTNCVAPILKILHEAYKIKSAYFITTHAYTSTQKLIDGVDKKDLRRGRAAATDIVPSTSGAAQSVTEALPELVGKLDGYALRVPVPNGSLLNLIANLKQKATKEEINQAFLEFSRKNPFLEYCEEPIVSSDVIHNQNSCIFDSLLTSSQGNLISITAWYDNEYAYSSRIIDLLELIKTI